MFTTKPAVDDLRGRVQTTGPWPQRSLLLDAWQAHRQDLISLAWLAESAGRSWRPERPVKIGCAVLGFSEGVFDSLSFGYNNTPRPLSQEEKHKFKPCAEKTAIIHCLGRMLLPVGLVLSTGHNQPDDDTGLLLDRLACCSNCVRWMQAFLPPWFLVGSCCVQPDGSCKYTEWTLHELSLLHQEALRFKVFR